MKRLAIAWLGCCLVGPVTAAEPPDTIYIGGTIVTVDAQQPTVEAIAIAGGKIAAVGKTRDLLKSKGPDTRVVDLGTKALLPGFIDGHSHFINSLQVATQANCFSPPAGPARSIADIIAQLKKLQASQKIPPGEFIIGYGYDPDVLADKRELTAADLDPHFPNHPVMVQHVSLHGAVLNSRALQQFGVTADTPTPAGGVILRKPGTNEPSGLLMETAFMPIFASMPKPGEAEQLERLEAGQMVYAAAGITTAQEGATYPDNLALLQKGAAEGRLFLDVVAYPFIAVLDEVLQANPPGTFGTYQNHLKLGGIKITADGSPQGKTAFFTTPYLTGGPAGEKDWFGEPTFPKAQLQEMVRAVYDQNLQLIVHCNGDAAIDLVLEAHELCAPDRTAPRRTTIIHSQFVRPDQLEKYAHYNLLASFYTEHCFYFGDTHIQNRGLKQAEFISPMRAALDLGIHCANHTDFNVAPIDQLFVMWSAVNRVSRSGKVIGSEQRITPLEALKAITLDGAYLYSEEATKGSIEVGKLADLVILDKNPLTVTPATIKDLKVLETIKEGKTIYRAP